MEYYITVNGPGGRRLIIASFRNEQDRDVSFDAIVGCSDEEFGFEKEDD